MRVLHLCTYDNEGGVARAATRLHKGMLDAGVDSHFLCIVKTLADVENIHVVTKRRYKCNLLNKLVRLIRRFFFRDDYKLLNQYSNRTAYFTTSSVTTNFLVNINEINPDIVHIHWINELCRIEDIRKINRPIVWHLHDSAYFTGGCHVLTDCTKFQVHCGACPVLGSDVDKDLAYYVFERKVKYIKDLECIHLVASSRWMADNAKSSRLLAGKEVTIIHTGIDTSVFFPLPNKFDKQLTNKKIILFGANGAFTDKNKGFDLLVKAINDNLELFSDCEMWVFGNDSNKINTYLKIPIKILGFPHDNEMPSIYNQAHLTVVPSLKDCFPQVPLESMGCGTPVVAFGATGLLDSVIHLETGYLAQPYDTNDLAKGIKWVLDNNSENRLCINSRKLMLDFFDMKIVVNNFYSYYNTILNEKK
jgi:glycosyltransferase involved in cell wall biosynthesis